MAENIYPLDFMEESQYLSIIKRHLPEGITISNVDRKEWQIHLILSNGERIILNFDKNKRFQLNLTQCPRCRDEIFESLKEPLNLLEVKGGKRRSNIWKLYSGNLSYQLKSEILKRFRGKVKPASTSPEQFFVLLIKGKNALVHMKNGELHLNIQRPNKITDEIFEFIEKFLRENVARNKRRLSEIDVGKESFEVFLQKNIGITLIKHIDREVYDFLSGRDIWEIEDGLNIYHVVKEHNIQLKNYKVLVRSFSVALEGFLIKYFLELGLINREAYEQDPNTAKIGGCIGRFRKAYQPLVERTHKGLLSKLKGIWNECRNNYLHSDMYSYSELLNIEQAEAKIVEILTTMKQLLEVLPYIKGEENDTEFSGLQDDENV